MIMRWILASFLVGTGIYLMRGNSVRHLAVRRVVFTLFIVAGFSSLVFAEYWTKFSQILGVESGTSLLTYLITFAFIASTISNYRWRREQEQRIVELTRQMLIKIEKNSELPE